MKVSLLYILFVLAGCASRPPACLSSGAADVIGACRYVGERTSAKICRPESITFHADGTFEARYSGCDLLPIERQHINAPGSTHFKGHWFAGAYCAQRLFVPIVVVETDPNVPNTIDMIVRS